MSVKTDEMISTHSDTCILLYYTYGVFVRRTITCSVKAIAVVSPSRSEQDGD